MPPIGTLPVLEASQGYAPPYSPSAVQHYSSTDGIKASRTLIFYSFIWLFLRTEVTLVCLGVWALVDKTGEAPYLVI